MKIHAPWKAFTCGYCPKERREACIFANAAYPTYGFIARTSTTSSYTWWISSSCVLCSTTKCSPTYSSTPRSHVSAFSHQARIERKWIPTIYQTQLSTHAPMLPNAPRQHRLSRGRMNGLMLPPIGQPLPFMSHIQQPNQFANPLKDHQMKYMPGRHPDEISSQLVIPPIASNQQGAEMLSSMLAAAGPQQQKQILGERLFSLVERLESLI